MTRPLRKWPVWLPLAESLSASAPARPARPARLAANRYRSVTHRSAVGRRARTALVY